MFNHYHCRVLLVLLLCVGDRTYAQSTTRADSQSGQGKRTEIVRVASYAQPGVKTLDESSANSGRRAISTAKIYAADILNADWKTQSGSFSCLLTHHIEGFGNAVLSRKTGSGEIFYLTPQGSVVFPRGATSMDTLPPAWRSEQMPVHLGSTTAVAGDRPIKLAAADFTPLLEQLSSDAKVMFTSSSSQDAGGDPSSLAAGVMRVVLDPKNFAKAYKAYQQCMEVLIPYTFSQVSHLSFNYPAKAEGLNAAHKTELNKVARYVKADPEVLGILVDAHSDNQGSPEENELISKQESEWVSAYLVLQGVESNKITARWHGDKFPVANNKTDAGRSQNRRVTVRLENEATRRDAEEKAVARLATEEREALKAAAEEQKKQAIAAQQEEKRKLAEAEALAKEQEQKKLAAERPRLRSSARPEHISTKMAPRESSQRSSNAKVTPEEIGKMVDGLDLIPKQ